jgi:hypothetical protein
VPRDLALHLVALLVYPGALLTLAVGIAAEAAAGVLLGGARPRAALLDPLVRLRAAATAASGLPLAVPLLAVLAATQLAVPLDPVSPVTRNLLVAAVALAAAMWLGRVRDWATPAARAMLLVQVCWLVALLAPALVSESLRPQALGAVVVPSDLPLKVVAGLLALLCLPMLLRLPPSDAGGAGEEPVLVRLFLWLPLCGLVASLLLPSGGDDLAGVLRFAGATLAVAAASIGLAALSARTRHYPRVLAPLAAVVVGIAAVTSVLT